MCDFCLRLFGVKLNFHPNPSDASTLRAEESYLKAKLYSVQIAASLRKLRIVAPRCPTSTAGFPAGARGLGPRVLEIQIRIDTTSEMCTIVRACVQ